MKIYKFQNYTISKVFLESWIEGARRIHKEAKHPNLSYVEIHPNALIAITSYALEFLKLELKEQEEEINANTK